MPVGAHEVPGRRPAGARGAGPGPGGRDQQRGPPGGAAQAPRRDRPDPREDRGPRHLAARAPRRGRRRLRRGQVAHARACARTPGIEAAPEEVDADRAGRRLRCRRASGRAAVGRSRDSSPTPSSPPTSRPPGRPRPGPRRLASWELLGPLFSSFERAGGGASACMALPDAGLPAGPGRPGADAAPGAGGRRRRSRPPDLPARRRAGPGQDGSGAARRAGGERLPAARGRAERRQDQLGPRGRPLDTEPLGHRDPRQRGHDRRLRRHRHRQLRGARPPRGLARRPRLPRHGRRRGALHQEQVLPALAARAGALRAHPARGSRVRC